MATADSTLQQRPGPEPESPALAAAGLRYTSDEEPGYRRRRRGRGWSYADWRGRTVRSERLRRRFGALVIPPAWTEVWICRHPDGHLQATGRDQAGRKQYLYHPRWRESRDREKFGRVAAFARRLPAIRRRVERDLRRPGLAREKVLAAVVRLLESTFARVGNDEYARRNGSYGLTTIRKRHVEVDDDEGVVALDFEGKGGKPWRIEVEEPEVMRVVAECLETPGHELFKYFDDAGEKRDVTAADVNEYLREAAGADVTAKDFRTWAGTVLAVRALREEERRADEPTPARPARSARPARPAQIIERVADALGNTPAVCRDCYIHPAVLAALEDGAPAGGLEGLPPIAGLPQRDRAELDPDETAALALLECAEEAS